MPDQVTQVQPGSNGGGGGGFGPGMVIGIIVIILIIIVVAFMYGGFPGRGGAGTNVPTGGTTNQGGAGVELDVPDQVDVDVNNPGQ